MTKVKKLPTVTIIIITWNVERTISKVLKSIKMQDYPSGLVDILAVDGNSTDNTAKIVNSYGKNALVIQSKYPKDPEACRGVGLKVARGEIIAFIDSDNYLPTKSWLTDMVTPFVNHPEVVGTETIRFAYRKKDNYLNRYFALIGSADPVGLYLGKADKLSYISNKWSLYGKKTFEGKKYFLIDLTPEKFPTLGSNGFCARRKLLLKAKSGPKRYFHIDVPLDLARMGHLTYGVVNQTIIHDTATGLVSFLKKRSSYMRLHYQKRASDRRYKVFDPSRKEDVLKILLFVLFSCTFVQPTYVSIKGYLKKPDYAWFIHPIFCFLIMITYTIAVTERFLKNITHNL